MSEREWEKFGWQPAFPNKDHMGDGPDGMSLREYYAGLAMAGLCANPNFNTDKGLQINGKKTMLEVAAVIAADALLAALSKSEE